MKKIVFILATFVLLSSCSSKEENTVLAVAEEWLKLLDQKQYSDAWYQLDEFSKAAQGLKKSDWIRDVEETRKAVGDVKKRKLSGSQNLSLVTGKTKGGYAYLLMFSTDFENSRINIEHLMVSNNSGSWKVANYSVLLDGKRTIHVK